MLNASALSHVTQHSSHNNRKPQKQTGHPLSYPSTLHFPKYNLLLRNISSFPSPLPTAKKHSLVHQLLPTNVTQVYVTSWSIPSYLKTSSLINNLLVFINASTHVASPVHFSKKAKLLTLFFTTKETRKITDCISCHSKNLIHLIQCKKCHCRYIGETKRQLNERFAEHRRSILNRHQLSNPGHSINDVHLIPLELMRSTRDSVRKAREAHLINKVKTLHPLGINRRDEARQ